MVAYFRVVGPMLKVVVVVGLLSCIAIAATASKSADDVRVRQMKAYRSGGYKAAAAVTGEFVRTTGTTTAGPVSIQQLAAFSQVVFLGTPADNWSFIGTDGNIYTAIQFQLQEVLKGAIAGTVPVVVPGGRVGFDDGSWAQLNVLGLRRPTEGSRYLVFARRALPQLTEGARQGEQLYEPAFDGLGLYEQISGSQIVRPSGGTDSAFARQLRRERTTGDQFLAAVRNALR